MILSYDMSNVRGHVAPITTVGLEEGHRFKIELDVCVEMMEGFRHTLNIIATWSPRRSEDAQESTNNADMMEIEDVQGQRQINVAAAFNLS
jgi:hypothetical protein